MSGRRKIMVLGHIGVGKTSLIRRLVFDRFEGTYSGTLGFDLYTYTLSEVGPAKASLPVIVWDTDGNAGINILRHNTYMGGCSGAMIVGDLTRPNTVPLMLELAQEFAANYPGRPYMFLLNKADLASEKGLPLEVRDVTDTREPYLATSAKSGDHVVDAFRDLGATILRREE